MTDLWTPNENDLVIAENDLEWFFAQCAAALGEHGSGFEGSGATAWDEMKIWAVFLQHRQKSRREAVQKWYEVTPALRRVSPWVFQNAACIYQPFPWPANVRSVWLAERKSAGVVTLAGAAIRAPATLEAYRKAHPPKKGDDSEPPTPTVPVLISWAERVLQQSTERDRKGRLIRVPKWAAAALEHARGIRGAVATAYARASHERLVEELSP